MRNSLIASLVAAGALAACSSTPPAPAQPAAAPAPAASAPAAAPRPAAAPAPAPAPSAPAAAAPRPAPPGPWDPRQLKNPALTNLLSKRSVYFDYNKYDITEDYITLVNAHAVFLQKNPTYKVQVQGNADERGSKEYNLALGQKRADAVKKAMVATGTSAAQIETVSFGEEKPRAAGTDEEAYAQNRRADLAYPGD